MTPGWLLNSFVHFSMSHGMQSDVAQIPWLCLAVIGVRLSHDFLLGGRSKQLRRVFSALF